MDGESAVQRPVRALFVFPQSTHPVVNGAQVRVNLLLRHLTDDLGWEVDFYAAQGLLRRESWGENMDRLRKLFVPSPERRPRRLRQAIKFPHVRAALHKGVIEGLYKDVRDNLKRLIVMYTAANHKPTFTLHTFVNEGIANRGNEHHASPVSERLKVYDAPHYRDSLREIIESEQYDVVIVGYVWLSRMVEWLFDQPRRPMLVCDTIDVQYMREQRLQAFRSFQSFDFEKEKALELSLIAKYDAALTITEVDRDELRLGLPDADIRTVMVEMRCPPGYELDAAAYAVRRDEQHQYDLLFIGAANEANRLAALTLLRNIMPRLAERRPDISLALAGRICDDPAVRRAAMRPGVKILGYVQSVPDYYASGRVLAAPIPAGGGVKIKVLEAMAHGVPVVTTPVGAEGTPLENGVHGAIVDDNDAFTDAVLKLLGDASLLERCSLAAQQCVREELSPKKVYEAFDALPVARRG
ncbi:MAG: glycosyltransferase [Candidatus Hydrogenedens sp.]|nr:glycosyltransferase [Candidatus Hydrogenedens sp.]